MISVQLDRVPVYVAMPYRISAQQSWLLCLCVFLRGFHCFYISNVRKKIASKVPKIPSRPVASVPMEKFDDIVFLFVCLNSFKGL